MPYQLYQPFHLLSIRRINVVACKRLDACILSTLANYGMLRYRYRGKRLGQRVRQLHKRLSSAMVSQVGNCNEITVIVGNWCTDRHIQHDRQPVLIKV